MNAATRATVRASSFLPPRMGKKHNQRRRRPATIYCIPEACKRYQRVQVLRYEALIMGKNIPGVCLPFFQRKMNMDISAGTSFSHLCKAVCRQSLSPPFHVFALLSTKRNSCTQKKVVTVGAEKCKQQLLSAAKLLLLLLLPSVRSPLFL